MRWTTPEEKPRIGKFDHAVWRDEPEVVEMRDFMTAWATANHAAIRDADTEMPALGSGPDAARRTEIWEPLVTIADLLGGDWGTRIREIAVSMEDTRDAVLDPTSCSARR